ncbi:hypothetical protein [Rhizobium sp.]
MNRSLSLVLAFAGVLVAGNAFAQATTSDPLGINVIDEPTLTQQRGAIGQNTSSTVPTNQRNVWDNGGTFKGFNFDGSADQ